jgi:SAM-dependent methyltransferase
MKCPYCGSESTKVYYRANMPLVLSACSEKMLDKSIRKVIEVSICESCLLGFNSCRLTQEELKEIYDNYLYISPMNGIGETKYISMINTLRKYFSKNDKILEIGCSEGYLLKKLRDFGYKNLSGVEPGPQADVAKKVGFNIIKEYFDEENIKEKYDGFYLMHVFEHFPNPFVTLAAMKNLLNDNGKIIIEVPNFQGYHHQHLFFYNLYFMDKLCKDNELKIIEYSIEKDALRVVIVKKENIRFNEINYMFNKEGFIKSLDMYYQDFNNKVKKVNEIVKNNKDIYWWGAGSSSVIYLNQIEKNLDYKSNIIVVDGDKNKEGLYIPGVNLKVNSFAILENKEISTLVVASSFYEEIKNTMKNFNINAKHIDIIY